MDRRELPPPWLDARIPWDGERHAPLVGRLAVDVAVVGAGITGLTAALLLARAGKSVAVLEAARVGAGETGRSSGHLTHVVDAWLPDLVDRRGLLEAKAVWDGARFGVEMIADIVAAEGIACDFVRVPQYLYATDREKLERFGALAREIGYACGFATGLPVQLALEFPDQARIHPLKYLGGLVRSIVSRGGRIFEGSRVTDVRGPASAPDGVRVTTEEGGEVVCENVVLATHVPAQNRVFVHTKQAPYRTYVIALSVAKGSFPDVLLDELAEPYHYVRIQPRLYDDLLIVGGEDHKTGQEEDHEGTLRFERLASYARDVLHVTAPVAFQWSGQIVHPADDLPFIGLNINSRDEYVATGYSGDGLTLGTLAAHMIAERILGGCTAWDELFAPARIELETHAVKKFIGENKDYPLHLLKDWFTRVETTAGPEVLRPGEGGLFKVRGHRLAVSRDDSGRLIAVTAACPHMGCAVHWNDAECTWDCPCHGSRFAADGGVINGPAPRGLTRQELIVDPVDSPVLPLDADGALT